MSLLAGHGIIQICGITCEIIQMCCLTFIDNNYWAGYCAEQVMQAEPQLHSFMAGTEKW